MFRKTLLVSIILMIFAFSKSELVLSRASGKSKDGDVFTKKGLNCTQYGAVEDEGGCKCPRHSYFMGTCTPDEEIGCQTKAYAIFKEGKLYSMSASTSNASIGFRSALRIGKGIDLGYMGSMDAGECNKLDDIFLWNTGASGISGDWVSIRSEGRKLWDNKVGYLVSINSDDMAGQLIKVVPASGCVNITCAFVKFSGDVTYPVNIQKLQIKETPAPTTSAPITSAPITTPAPEGNACGQFTPRYEYILTFLVLALAVIMRG